LILNGSDEHMGGNNMMDWSQNMWIYMILGFIIFLIFVMILIYYLLRKSHSSDERFNKKTVLERNETSEKEGRKSSCPNCGEKMGNILLNICPYCGSKLN
jgi:uncharacterized membrane protein